MHLKSLGKSPVCLIILIMCITCLIKCLENTLMVLFEISSCQLISQFLVGFITFSISTSSIYFNNIDVGCVVLEENLSVFAINGS